MRIEHPYEVHIVAYHKSKLANVPFPFKKFIITAAEGNAISEIATAETQTLKEAVEAFNIAIQWKISKKKRGAMHIKLEQLLGETTAETLNATLAKKIPYPTMPTVLTYAENYFLGAFGWDVHIDGTFNTKLRKKLIQKGWIFMDYISSTEKACTTLTQHFLSRQSCKEAYSGIISYVKNSGGFKGQIYWEMPVRYLVIEARG